MKILQVKNDENVHRYSVREREREKKRERERERENKSEGKR